MASTPPHIASLTRRLRQLGYEVIKRGGVVKLMGNVLGGDFKLEISEV